VYIKKQPIKNHSLSFIWYQIIDYGSMIAMWIIMRFHLSIKSLDDWGYGTMVRPFWP